MKYNYDSYMLYYTGKTIRNAVRARVIMKQPVDIDILRNAVNVATNRYPYFKKKVTVNDEGAYVLVDNNNPIAVFPTKKKAPPICSKEVNEHMVYVDTEGKDIYFCISHTLAGGKGIQPWIMTCIYEYVIEKFGVEINAPAIRKPDSDLLPTELIAPSFELLPKDKPIYKFSGGKAASLIKDYINGFINPFAKNENYYIFEFEQSEFMNFSKENDFSVASLFTALMFKAMDKILPQKENIIRGTLAHNPCATIGIPDSHCDFLSHIHVDYRRDMAGWDMEKLGTISRGQMILQADETVATIETRKKLELIKGIDSIKGLKEKRKYAKENNMSLGKDSIHGTYHINYTGYFDWGELENYVDLFVYIVDGHMVTEASSIGDKIIFAPMALVRADKYIDAFCSVLNELKISYKLSGPFQKNLPYQEIPR